MTDLKNISTIELEKQLLKIKQICLQNCELSAHILDLKIKEMKTIYDELESRKNEIKKEVIDITGRLFTEIKADAYKNRKDMEDKHYLAIRFVEAMRGRAMAQMSYARFILMWAQFGNASALRDTLLKPLGYNNDLMDHFNAFVLLDDCAIRMRDRFSHTS